VPKPARKPYRRGTPEEIAARVSVIRDGLIAGKGCGQIAEELGVAVTRVYDAINADPSLKDAKKLPSVGPLAQRAGVAVGALAPALRSNGRSFVEWLIAQTPEGGTMAEVAVACAFDAYQDDLDVAAATQTSPERGK